MSYEAVIGLEVHVQLKTSSKMFTRAANRYGEPPNTLTNPVVMGMPGVLPVLNREAIAKTIKVGLIFGCEISEMCKWDRKNYFYPDMPKNYQISQYDQPVCTGGEVEIELPGSARNIMGEHKKIRLTRIHLEEDVGKLTHFDSDSLVDYNRAGTPLLEIVSEPVLQSAEEAFAFLTALRMNLRFAGISDCDMEKGQLRCDANISVRPRGAGELGAKIELKNMNTISGVRNGIDYEIKRQVKSLEEGKKLTQETRRWDASSGFTTSMRSKEYAHDYRYFPDPDLMPVKIDLEWKKALASELPELPFDKQRRFMKDYDLPYTITSVLCTDRPLSEFFEEAVRVFNKPRAIANLVANDLQRERAAAGSEGPLNLSQCLVKPEQVADLVRLTDEGAISKQTAQDVFVEMFKSGEPPADIVERKGLKQSVDTEEIEKVCVSAIEANPKAADQFKAGREGAINALKGHVMKATRGQSNPKLVDEILRHLLS